AGNQDLSADLVAEAVPRDAVLLQCGTQLLDRELVVAGDALDRTLERGVIHPQRALLRKLDLCAHDDQALQQLALENVVGRQLDAQARELELGLLDAVTQLQ